MSALTRLKSQSATKAVLVPFEHDEQVALMHWAALNTKRVPALAMIFAVPNAGRRSHFVGRMMKAEGMSAGVPDLFLMKPMGMHHGLAIEMKRVNGKPSDTKKSQAAWHKRLSDEGYMVVVAYGFVAARDAVCAYLGVKP